MLRPAALILGASLLLYLLLYFVPARRDAARASLALSVFLFLFFLFDQFQHIVPFLRTDFLIFVSPYAAGADSAVIVLPIWGAVCAAAVWLSLRARKDLSALCWVIGSALVIPSAARLTSGIMAQQRQQSSDSSSGGIAAGVPKKAGETTETGKPATADASPDLYVIVLDGYGRHDVLQRMYRFDNTPFIAELEKRGFFVARRSRSNYIQTVLSLAAMLNLDYLSPGDGNSGALDLIQPKIDRSKIASLLRERGYRFVSISTGFPLTATPSADVNLAMSEADIRRKLRHSVRPFPTPFEGLLIDKTPFAALHRLDTHLYAEHRERLLGAFGYLSTTAEELPYPKFVFAHIIAPHPPFVFGPKGEPRQPDRPFTLGDATDFRGGAAAYRQGYADQARFINRKTLEAVDAIRKDASRPAVIVVMGDHGPRSETNWRSRQKTNVQEAFANLLAVSYPDGDAGSRFERDAGEEITPINALRLVLNHEFGMAYAPLPDSSYYSAMRHPLDFTDVTAEARAEAGADRAQDSGGGGGSGGDSGKIDDR